MINSRRICGMIVALSLAAVSGRADSLELKNGSFINGKFMGGTQTSLSFQVGSSAQSYDCRRYPFAPIRCRCAGYLAVGSLEAAECAFRERRR